MRSMAAPVKPLSGEAHPQFGKLPPNAKRNDIKILARVCNHARHGRSKTQCFRLSGVSPDTGFLWLKIGRAGEDPLLARFERILERAVAHFSAQQLQMIEGAAQSGANNTWQAAAWLLERRNPEDWGRRDVTKIEADAPLIQLNQVILADPETRALGRELLKRVAGPKRDEELVEGEVIAEDE